MSEYIFVDPLATPTDELFARYLDDVSLFDYPLTLKMNYRAFVVRSDGELVDMLLPRLSARIEETMRENDEDTIDLLPIFASLVSFVDESVVAFDAFNYPDDIWEDECVLSFIRAFDDTLPVALFDENGVLWQANTQQAVLGLFTSYVENTWGRDKNLDECWDVFSEVSELNSARVLVRAYLNNIYSTLSRAHHLHNPSDVYFNSNDGFIVNDGLSATHIEDDDDFADHIVYSASAASDLVSLFDMVSSWSVYLRPTMRDLGRAIDDSEAYKAGGWNDYPYEAVWIEDEQVRGLVASAIDFLQLSCDCSLDEWIDDAFDECPDVSDMAERYLDILPQWRRIPR